METEAAGGWLEAAQPSFAPSVGRNRRSGASPLAPSSASKGADGGFGALLGAIGETAAASQRSAADVVASYARGTEGPMHEGAIALEKSDITFKFLVTAKNKAIEAYKETMRMAG